MLNQTDDFGPFREPGPFDQCSGLDEVLLVLHRLGGMDAVDAALAGTGSSRQTLREAANKLDAVGLKPLALLVRKHLRRAPLKPDPAWHTVADRGERGRLFLKQRGRPFPRCMAEAERRLRRA